jgi:hypothetical protein
LRFIIIIIKRIEGKCSFNSDANQKKQKSKKREREDKD